MSLQAFVSQKELTNTVLYLLNLRNLRKQNAWQTPNCGYYSRPYCYVKNLCVFLSRNRYLRTITLLYLRNPFTLCLYFLGCMSRRWAALRSRSASTNHRQAEYQPNTRQPIRVPTAQFFSQWSAHSMQRVLVARSLFSMLPTFAKCTVFVFLCSPFQLLDANRMRRGPSARLVRRNVET